MLYLCGDHKPGQHNLQRFGHHEHARPIGYRALADRNRDGKDGSPLTQPGAGHSLRPVPLKPDPGTGVLTAANGVFTWKPPSRPDPHAQRKKDESAS